MALGAFNAILLSIIMGMAWRTLDQMDEVRTGFIELKADHEARIKNLEDYKSRMESRGMHLPPITPFPSLPDPAPAPSEMVAWTGTDKKSKDFFPFQYEN